MRRRHSGQPRLNKPKCARRIRHSARRIRKNNEKPMINPGKSWVAREKRPPLPKSGKNGSGPTQCEDDVCPVRMYPMNLRAIQEYEIQEEFVSKKQCLIVKIYFSWDLRVQLYIHWS
jgi:hypothetical protein